MFPERLRAQRKRKGLTQKGLAEIVKVSEMTIHRLEGGNRDPNITTLRELAAALGTTTAYLLGETDDPAPAGAANGNIMQTVTSNSNIGTNMVATTMAPSIAVSEAVMPESKAQTPWWPDVLAKAYEMEYTGDPRVREAEMIVRAAADVLKRACEVRTSV